MPAINFVSVGDLLVFDFIRVLLVPEEVYVLPILLRDAFDFRVRASKYMFAPLVVMKRD